MARALWEGYISFGLVNIPVLLFSAENRVDLHFRMLDSRNNARIRYERINEETGKEVPWGEVVKAYEYEKGSYVVVSDEEIEKYVTKHSKTIQLESFVDSKSLDYIYFEKPYYLVPDKRGEKGYVLLRDTLLATKKIGIAKVAIRTREYLAALMPYQDVLVVNLLRYPQEIQRPAEIAEFSEKLKNIHATQKEKELAKELVESLSTRWDPKQYQDENRLALRDWIDKKIEKQEKGEKFSPKKVTEKKKASNVLDMMELLKKSLHKHAAKKPELHHKKYK